MCVCLSVCVCMGVCMQTPTEAQKVLACLELELQAVMSFQCGCWDLNSSPLRKQQAFLSPEPSLSPSC